ncbi:glucosamine-link cellobiase [Vibrio variabilis]|uniref:Glucosamine-link cellobiase n=1 Tax=Vibrio variabilis TaxID=990271 RepID=A0ABQ0JDK0_9VIBR|nr:glucosamine-link cellobiase [Vibrio variabilis]
MCERIESPNFVATRLLEEALYGAEFLSRMQHHSGYFYMTVFDKWSKDPTQREICAYETQLGHKKTNHEAGFRQGGGMTIAALAKSSQVSSLSKDSAATYLEAAKAGYWHLKEHNEQYLDDHTPNIIDEYCALVASVALYQATLEPQYLTEARSWFDALTKRALSDQQHAFYWSANEDGSRPYFHAAEAGLPNIALTEYLAIETEAERVKAARETLNKACQFEINITRQVYNPFGYPRQYVKAVDGVKHDAFFIPHQNESGYWWQGENARLASLASMAFLAQSHLEDSALKAQLSHYADDCISWVLGAIPMICACSMVMATTTPTTYRSLVSSMLSEGCATVSPQALKMRLILPLTHQFIKTTCYKIGAGVSSGFPMQAGYFSLWHCGSNTIRIKG